MIQLRDKYLCCGCEACVQVCPNHCITFKADEEGFLYPIVDLESCIDCCQCERVCPVINQGEKRKPLQSFAAKNPNEEERLKSSSGGLFILLARKTIEYGGVVFGARFDNNWNVVHSYCETVEGIKPFMGSKYVQSRIGNNYLKVRQFLQNGRKVLFSGTPCQIAGLKRFLNKNYDNLLTVDLICHGVPSPAVWSQYVDEIEDNACNRNEKLLNNHFIIKDISFRDKRYGWKNFCFAFSLAKASAVDKQDYISLAQVHDKDPYFLGFNDHNLYLRPSCMRCHFRDLRSGSDITLADFWGIDTLLPELDDDKGVSMIMANTNKGMNVVKTIGVELHHVSFSDIVRRNPSISNNSIPSTPTIDDIFRYKIILDNKREYFFYDNIHSVSKRVFLLGKPGIKQRIKQLLRKIYHKLK